MIWIGVAIGVVLGGGLVFLGAGLALSANTRREIHEPERALDAVRYGPSTTTRRMQ